MSWAKSQYSAVHTFANAPSDPYKAMVNDSSV